MTQPSTPKSKLAMYSIGTWELFFWVQTVQVGIGILSLPRVLAEEAGHSGWLAIPLSGMPMQVSILFMILLLRRFESLDIYDILRLLFGKWLGNGIGFLFAVYCALAAALVTRTYIETVQTWLFPTTSTSIFYWLLLLPTFYLAASNPRVLGRFAIITFIGTIWMAFLLYAPIKEIRPDYYFPLFDTTWANLFKGTLQASQSIIGFEVLLVFYPYIQNKKRALKIASLGAWTTIVIYLYITLIAFGFYSQGQLQTLLMPTVHMLQIVQLPIIERIEHIGIATWAIMIVSTTSSYVWAAGRFLAEWPKWEKRSLYLFVLPVVASGAWRYELSRFNKLSQMFGYVGGGVCLFFPLLLLITALLLGKKGIPDPMKEEEKKAS